jgi:hypothetical protein
LYDDGSHAISDAPTPAERYLFSVASGQWKGYLDFRITSLRGWALSAAPLGDKLLAAGLHAVCRLPGRIGVCAQIQGQPSRGIAHNRTLFQYEGFFLVPPIPLARMTGMFRAMGPSGLALETRHGDGLGLWPGGAVAHGAGRVAPDGDGASYTLPVFGPGWTGVYRAATTVHPADTVDVRYTLGPQSWGELTYRAHRVEPPRATAPAERVRKAQERMWAVGRRLEAHANALRGQHNLLACFTDVYALETFDIADALDGRFDDPSWVSEIACTFGERFLAALEGHLGGGYVPPHWRVTFAACVPERACAIDALFSMIFTHIVGDLPETLAAIGAPSDHIHDFTTVDRIVEEGVDRVLGEFAFRYGPAYEVWNRLAGGIDRRAVLPWVTALRREAFFLAVRLGGGDEEREAARDEATRRVERLVSRVHYPQGAVARSVARTLRRWVSGRDWRSWHAAPDVAAPAAEAAPPPRRPHLRAIRKEEDLPWDGRPIRRASSARA